MLTVCRALADVRCPPHRLNQDANYKKAMGDVIDFKHHGLTRLVKVLVLPPLFHSIRARARDLH